MKYINKTIAVLSLILILGSCSVEDGQNLNGVSTSAVSNDISRGELQNATAGIFSDMRSGLTLQTDVQAVFGREYWRFQSSDPRYTGDLLTANLDNNAFYSITPYAARYANIKNIGIVLEGLADSSAGFTDQEVAAIEGFLNTMKAHEFLMLLNQQYENGIRLETSDPNNLGPFVSYEEGLASVSNMLGQAYTSLLAGGDEFAFSIPSGFTGFDTPASFARFNAAIHARVQAYIGNYPLVLSLLNDSFYSLDGDLREGAYFTFSLTGADVPNGLFFAVNATTGNTRVAHPSFVEDISPDDNRLNKVVRRETPITLANLTGNFSTFIYTTNTDPVAIIRNEELIFLFAEANYENDPAAAIIAINRVRSSAGLPPYIVGSRPLLDEILYQKRFSLYAEGGHRWIDLRRFERLSVLPIDRQGDAIAVQLPTPLTENR
jgi:hypothetical protein